LLRGIGILNRPRVDTKSLPQRILISHPITTVGDVILVLPLIEVIHERWPEALIDIAVGASMADLFVGHPHISNVFRYKTSHYRSPIVNKSHSVLLMVALYRREIMHLSYDLAIAPRWDSDIYAFLARYLVYFTGAPKRWSYSASVDGGNTQIDCLLTQVATGGELEHEVLRYTRLIDRAGWPGADMRSSISIDAPIQRIIEVARENNTDGLKQLLAELDAPSLAKYAVISLGATNPRRIWPVERLAELIVSLNRKYGFSFLIIGIQTDAPLCEWLAQRTPEVAFSLAGRTNILETASIIQGAALFIGNDSGPGHIAGALGVPSVIVSSFPRSCKEDHPNSPVRFRPCGPKVKVVQPAAPLSPCHSYCDLNVTHCITQVGVDEVLEAVESLLGPNAGTED